MFHIRHGVFLTLSRRRGGMSPIMRIDDGKELKVRLQWSDGTRPLLRRKVLRCLCYRFFPLSFRQIGVFSSLFSNVHLLLFKNAKERKRTNKQHAEAVYRPKFIYPFLFAIVTSLLCHLSFTSTPNREKIKKVKREDSKVALTSAGPRHRFFFASVQVKTKT